MWLSPPTDNGPLLAACLYFYAFLLRVCDIPGVVLGRITHMVITHLHVIHRSKCWTVLLINSIFFPPKLRHHLEGREESRKRTGKRGWRWVERWRCSTVNHFLHQRRYFWVWRKVLQFGRKKWFGISNTKLFYASGDLLSVYNSAYLILILK